MTAPIVGPRREPAGIGWPGVAGLALALTLGTSIAAGASEARDDGRFVVETNDFVIGQAPDWLDRTHVVWHDAFGRDEDGDGDVQIHRSRLDGGEKACLTCGLEGPNQVPVAQPHGSWILFHSWNGHAIRVGAPGFGGLGSDLWVMTKDGQQRTNLTPSAEFHDAVKIFVRRRNQADCS